MSRQIGPYRVEREIGRGGMGVVHLAHDTRLDRPVAIKALPAELAQDPSRLERFEREARTLAALSHPNLAGIFGVEEQDGARYLILEYVDGQTLAERLDRGPLSLDETLELGIQIAAGIEAAHDAGIIHRDLKPANIKITPEGQAKVLDFGLARADDQTSASGTDTTPTVTIPQPQHSPTIAGAILGTAAYMSPEQARGRRVDKRSDLWSFGVVLYEMLVGASPFQGETAGDSMGAVLHKEIELDKLPPTTPLIVQRLIRRCLIRDKLARLQAIGDARVELQEARAQLESGEHESVAALQPAKPSKLWPAVALALLLVCAGLLALLLRTSGTESDPTALAKPAAHTPSIVSVSRLTDFPVAELDPALSPDGRTLLYAARDGDNLDLYALRVGGSNPINLTPNSEADDFDPVFSPDGERIAFVSGRQGGGIFVMGATGENPRRVADEGFAPDWSPDGAKLVFTTDNVNNPYARSGRADLKVLDLTTSQVSPIQASDPDLPDGDRPDAVSPAWSPDGRHIAFWAVKQGQRDLYTVTAEGGERTPITSDLPTDWAPMWAADSKSLLFLSDRSGQRTLWSIPLDGNAKPAGEPVPLMPGPVTIAWAAKAPASDRLVIASAEQSTSIFRADFDPITERFTSVPTAIFTSAEPFQTASLSPDARWFAYTSGPPEEDIYLVRVDGTDRRRLTQDPYKSRDPVFSPATNTITYFSNRSGTYAIWEMDRDGNNQRLLLDDDATGQIIPIWTRDGQTMASIASIADPVLRLHRRTASGILEPIPTDHDALDVLLAWSPDGTRLLGLRSNQQDLYAFHIFDTESGDITPITGPNGEAMLDLTEFISDPGWIDNNRILHWDDANDSFFVFNLATKTAAYIESPVTNSSGIIDIPDGTTIYFTQQVLNSDLWLIELDNAPTD